MLVTAKFYLPSVRIRAVSNKTNMYWWQKLCTCSKYIFVTNADVSNDLLPINIGFATTARIRLANEILLSPTYRFLSVNGVVFHHYNARSHTS